MDRLKKAFVLFLVLVITLPGETAHAFSFVPKLISHYNHHNEEHHEISFLDFIGEHFTSHEQHDRHEHHDDEQENCPFSHNHTAIQFVYILKKYPTLVIEHSELILDIEKSELPNYLFTFSEYNGSIWQPPKI